MWWRKGKRNRGPSKIIYFSLLRDIHASEILKKKITKEMSDLNSLDIDKNVARLGEVLITHEGERSEISSLKTFIRRFALGKKRLNG